MKIPTLALALAGAFLALPAASRIVPAEPTAFELVNLRMTVDSCAFAPSTVRVRAEGATLKVTQQPNNCLVPGTPQIADVQLGALAPGLYRVEVYSNPAGTGEAEVHAFQVRELVEIAVFPPPPRPLTSYSGMWWSPQESGWGLALVQGVSHALLGTWFVYGSGGQPEWYTLQGGQWTSSTRWAGQVYRTTGPFFAGPDFDPRLVRAEPAGTATLDFSQSPGDEDRARFTYTVGGVAATKVIARMAF